MSLDLIRHERKQLTMLDMLSEIGGFSGLVFSTFALFQGLWNFNALENYMVSRLFKVKLAEDTIDRKKELFHHSEYIKDNKIPYFREILQRALPKICVRCCCLRKTRRERAMQMARGALAEEINIIEIIKLQRYFHSVIHNLLNEKSRMGLKARSRYHMIDPENFKDIRNAKALSILRKRRQSKSRE